MAEVDQPGRIPPDAKTSFSGNLPNPGRLYVPLLKPVLIRPGEAIGYMDAYGNSVIIENNGSIPIVERIVTLVPDLPRAPY